MSWPALRWVAERCTARGADRAILWAIAYHVNKDTGLAKLSMRTIASESGVSLMHVSRRIPLLEKSGQLEIEELGQGTRASTYRLPRAPEPRSVNTTWTQEQGRQDPVASTSQGRSVNIGDPVASTSAAATPLILEQVEEEQREQRGPPAKHETRRRSSTPPPRLGQQMTTWPPSWRGCAPSATPPTR